MDRMPVLFIGHGSPMNAIADNAYTRRLQELGRELPRPRAILCVSAHWLTQGTWVNRSARPRTIHDFGGFPRELFEVNYPAPGSPEVAVLVQAAVSDPQVQGDESWGLDHGTWSVLVHMYPQADIPVLQLSIDSTQPAEFHFHIGRQLARLREQGVLILGTGNVVHNLRQIRWQEDAPAFAWAVEFDGWVKERLSRREFTQIVHDYLSTPAGQLSVPTPDHFYPMLYVLGAALEGDQLRFEYEEIQNASISMLSFSFGR